MKYDAVKVLVPMLQLSPRDCVELRALGDQFVKETLDQYMQLHVERRGVVDKQQWKEVRRKHSIRLYTERKSSPFKATRPRCVLSEDEGEEAKEKPMSSPPLMIVGTLTGSVDDVMYAATTTTVDMMKIRSAYVEEGIVNAKVLQQIVSPSYDDPFRNLAVKWCVCHPPKVQSLIRPRDYVYLESTGITISDTGERFGFRVVHSLSLPQFPEFETSHGVVRGDASVCVLYRQRSPATVDCFVRGFIEFRGTVARSLAVFALVGENMPFFKELHCAQMKKIAWKLNHRAKQRHSVVDTILGNADVCYMCSRAFVSSGSSRFLRSIKRRCCNLCDKLVCSRCRLKKRLYFAGPHEPVHQDLSFCASCVNQAIEMDAYEVAKAEFCGMDDFNTEKPTQPTFSRTSSSNYSFEGFFTRTNSERSRHNHSSSSISSSRWIDTAWVQDE